MTAHDHDKRSEREDWLNDISAELDDVTASPGFAARVRATVEEEGGARGAFSWTRWMWMGSVVAGAAAIVLAMTMTRHGSEPASTAAVSQSAAAVLPIPTPLPPKAAAPAVPADVVTGPKPVPPRDRGPVATAAPHPMAPRPTTPPPAATRASIDMTVVTDQPDVLRRIWLGVPRDAIDPATADLKFREALVASTVPPPAVTELVVEPISIKPLDVPDAAGARSGGVRLVGDETQRSR